RRTMKGILGYVATNKFSPGVAGFPSETALSEAQINTALREIWKSSNGQVDLLVMNGREKRHVNEFVGSSRRFMPGDTTFTSLIGTYESDFGVCRIALSRWVPVGTVLLLDSSRVDV